MAKSLISPDIEQPAVALFFKTILRSGLLDQAQLNDAMRTAAPEQRATSAEAAEFLVKKGMLSRFQARKLLRGVTHGLVLGHYQILAPIGKGGQSIVYLARDARSQQLLALKVLPPRVAREEERMLARFRREMELCQRVAHPAICWTQEVGVCNGVYYIAMEFIPGKSLYRFVTAQGPLAVRRAAHLFAEVAAGLEHAHQQGLIHRDLKPSNILVTPHDHAKILDLGLALIEGEAPSDRAVVGGEGYIVGTMDYIAPEQSIDAIRVDARADIYSLGCALYFALTGTPPFAGGDARQKIQRHQAEEPTPIRDLNADVPAGFEAVLRKMMAKKPEDRYRSADALREDLLRWASGEPEQPPDQTGDTSYREAVADLDTETAWAELVDETVPEPSPSPETGVEVRPPIVLMSREPPPSVVEAPTWLVYAVLVAIVAFIGFFAAVAGLCYWLMR